MFRKSHNHSFIHVSRIQTKLARAWGERRLWNHLRWVWKHIADNKFCKFFFCALFCRDMAFCGHTYLLYILLYVWNKTERQDIFIDRDVSIIIYWTWTSRLFGLLILRLRLGLAGLAGAGILPPHRFFFLPFFLLSVRQIADKSNIEVELK